MMFSYLANIFFQGQFLFRRELRVRYRRTALSLLWVIIPTITASLGAVIASRQMNVSGSETSDYALKVFLGVALIQLFCDSFTSPQQIAMRCRQFVRFIPYTYEAILVAGVCFALLNFLIKFLLLLPLFVLFHVAPSLVGIPALLVSMLFLILFGVSLAALAIPLSYVYWDVRYGQSYVVLAALFATPVLYKAPTEGFLSIVNKFNPLTPLVGLGRDSFLASGYETGGVFFAILMTTFLTLICVAYYRRAMPIGISHI